MGFSIKPDFVVRSYEDAKEKYENTTPIRGRDDDIRPIGNRRNTHMRIIKNSDNSYSCRLYHTDVATFYPDGRIVYRDGGWATTSTANFMQACMPWSWGVNKINNCLQAYHHNKYYVVQDGFTIHGEQVSGYLPPTKQVVDRQASKEKREPYKKFLAFAHTYMNILNMPVPRDPDTWYGQCYRKADKFIEDVNSIPEEEWLEVLSGLAYHGAWDFEQKDYEVVKKEVYNRNTIYKTVPLPIGSLQP